MANEALDLARRFEPILVFHALSGVLENVFHGVGQKSVRPITSSYQIGRVGQTNRKLGSRLCPNSEILEPLRALITRASCLTVTRRELARRILSER
jgi:hypothetical protein